MFAQLLLPLTRYLPARTERGLSMFSLENVRIPVSIKFATYFALQAQAVYLSERFTQYNPTSLELPNNLDI